MNGYVARVRRDEQGFTLIELLIVIVILGILAGIVIFSVGAITDRGTLSACRTDRKTVEVAVEAFYAKHSSYPADLDPTLTTSPDQFLRPQTGLTGSSLTGNGYVVSYDSNTGEVTSNLANC